MADLTLRKLEDQPLTDWLQAWAAGDRSAANKLLDALAPFLERAAKQVLRANRAVDISVKELIHETWVRISASGAHGFESRRQFFGSAVRAMHFELVDRYRLQRRPPLFPPEVEPLEQDPNSSNRHALWAAFSTLEQRYPDHAEALLLHKLAGMTLKEVADELGKPLITVRRHLELAEAWIKRSMQ